MVVVMAYVRVASGSGGLSHQGTFSEAGASVVEGSPSTHPNFPCGQVHTNVWYFSASAPFMGNQELAYDGRLQFQRLAPSHAGEVRNARGSVVLEGGPEGNSMKISYALAGFDAPSSGSWTRYSVILRYAAAWPCVRVLQGVDGTAHRVCVEHREDHGWVHEPSNVAVNTEEMLAVLRNVSGLYIRGDEWAYGPGGSGQEVVYLNNVALITRVRDA